MSFIWMLITLIYEKYTFSKSVNFNFTLSRIFGTGSGNKNLFYIIQSGWQTNIQQLIWMTSSHEKNSFIGFLRKKLFDFK